MTFPDAVSAARKAALDAWTSAQAWGTSLADRDEAITAAYEGRLGGMTWADVVAEVNRGLPAGARLTVRTARLAWTKCRPRQEETG